MVKINKGQIVKIVFSVKRGGGLTLKGSVLRLISIRYILRTFSTIKYRYILG